MVLPVLKMKIVNLSLPITEYLVDKVIKKMPEYWIVMNIDEKH